MSNNTNNHNSDFQSQQYQKRLHANKHDALTQRNNNSRWRNTNSNNYRQGDRGGRHPASTYDHTFYQQFRTPASTSPAVMACPAQLLNAEKMVADFAASQPNDDLNEEPLKVPPGEPSAGGGATPSEAPSEAGKQDSTFSYSQALGRPPSLSYAAALGAAALTGATKTVNAKIAHINNFDVTRFSRDLHRARYFDLVDALQIYANKTYVELHMRTEDAAVTLARLGLNTHGLHLSFEVERPPLITVSLLGVSVHLPNQLVKEEMTRFGEVVEVWECTGRLLHRTVKNGTRIVQYKQLDRPIPSNVTVFGRRVRAIYSGQGAHLSAWKNSAETARQPAAVDNAANVGDPGGNTDVDLDVHSAQTGANMPAGTNPSPSMAAGTPQKDGGAAPEATDQADPLRMAKNLPPPPPQFTNDTDTTANRPVYKVPAIAPTPAAPPALQAPPPPTSLASPAAAPPHPPSPVVTIATEVNVVPASPTCIQPLSTDIHFTAHSSAVTLLTSRIESTGVRSRSLSPPCITSVPDVPDRTRRHRRPHFDKTLQPRRSATPPDSTRLNTLLDAHRNIHPDTSDYATDMEVIPATACPSTADPTYNSDMDIDRRTAKRSRDSDGTTDETDCKRKQARLQLHKHFTDIDVTRDTIYKYLSQRTAAYGDRHMAFQDLGVATDDLPTVHAWFLDRRFGQYAGVSKARTKQAVEVKSDSQTMKRLYKSWQKWSLKHEAVRTNTMDGIVETIRIHITSVVSTKTTLEKP